MCGEGMRAVMNLFARRRGVCSGKNFVRLQMATMAKVVSLGRYGAY